MHTHTLHTDNVMAVNELNSVSFCQRDADVFIPSVNVNVTLPELVYKQKEKLYNFESYSVLRIMCERKP